MNKKLFGYASVIFLLLAVGSSSALIDLTGTYHGGGDNPFNQNLNTTDSPTFVDLTITDDVDVADDIYIGDRMYHKDDEDSYWYFNPDELLFRVGDEMFVKMKQIDAGQDVFEGNPYGSGGDELSDIDFAWVQYDSGSKIFYIDAYNGRVGLFTTTPDQVLDVVGNVNFTGDVNVTGVTNSSGGFATDTGVGWSGTFTASEGVVTVRYGIIVDVDWD